VRIQGGGTRGLLLAFHQGVWGAVCDDIADVANSADGHGSAASDSHVNRGGGRKLATVVCRELGYQWGKEFNTEGGAAVSVVVDRPADTGPAGLNENHVQGCTGTEAQFKQCPNIRFIAEGEEGIHTCRSFEHVGVECSNQPIDLANYLANGTAPVATPKTCRFTAGMATSSTGGGAAPDREERDSNQEYLGYAISQEQCSVQVQAHRPLANGVTWGGGQVRQNRTPQPQPQPQPHTKRRPLQPLHADRNHATNAHTHLCLRFSLVAFVAFRYMPCSRLGCPRTSAMRSSRWTASRARAPCSPHAPSAPRCSTARSWTGTGRAARTSCWAR
jgi:hypothetical protein